MKIDKRCIDWDERLVAYIRETRTRPFEWGVQDCALWAAGAVDAMRETEYLADAAGAYDTLDGACEYLDKRGWKTLFDTATEMLGESSGSVTFAKRGDIIYMPTPPAHEDQWNRGCLLVCVGTEMIGPAPHELVWIPKYVATMLHGATFHV